MRLRQTSWTAAPNGASLYGETDRPFLFHRFHRIDGFLPADAPPLHGTIAFGDSMGSLRTYSCCTPHAVLWDMHGRTIALAPQAPRSIAFAIDAKHRVIGALLGRDGRHYAFLWDRGKLHLLDDLAQAPGWRFEGAYRFMPDGSIVGAGTHDGIATAFLMPVQDYSKTSAIR